MDDTVLETLPIQQRVGRPRRGTEAARSDLLYAAATRVFLRDGFRAASIDKVAFEAGVSTRTIYERFKNKADLLTAVIARLIDRDGDAMWATAVTLEPSEPRAALTAFGRGIINRANDPHSVALFRILATEAQRFPELAAKMRCANKERIENALAEYFRGQIRCGALQMADADRAAALFMQMICGDFHECMLFGSADDLSRLDHTAHLDTVISIFLDGALPRAFP